LLLYTVEVLDTLYYGVAKSIFEFDVVAEGRFCRFLCAALGLNNASTIASVLREVRGKQYSIERDSLKNLPNAALLNSNFLSELSKHLRQLSPVFAAKSVAFLLDDFSLPKVPEGIPRILLPLIWNSGGGYSFRVSAHSESVVTEDLRHNRYQVNREFREINLGANYINSIDASRNENAIETYIGDIFERRFSISKRLKGAKLQELLGPDYSGKIAQEIRLRTKRKTLHPLRPFMCNTAAAADWPLQQL
jgi:hypothetical protein